MPRVGGQTGVPRSACAGADERHTERPAAGRFGDAILSAQWQSDLRDQGNVAGK